MHHKPDILSGKILAHVYKLRKLEPSLNDKNILGLKLILSHEFKATQQKEAELNDFALLWKHQTIKRAKKGREKKVHTKFHLYRKTQDIKQREKIKWEWIEFNLNSKYGRLFNKLFKKLPQNRSIKSNDPRLKNPKILAALNISYPNYVELKNTLGEKKANIIATIFNKIFKDSAFFPPHLKCDKADGIKIENVFALHQSLEMDILTTSARTHLRDTYIPIDARIERCNQYIRNEKPLKIEFDSIYQIKRIATQQIDRINHWYFWNGRKKAELINQAIKKLDFISSKTDFSNQPEEKIKTLIKTSGLETALKIKRHGFFSCKDKPKSLVSLCNGLNKNTSYTKN